MRVDGEIMAGGLTKENKEEERHKNWGGNAVISKNLRNKKNHSCKNTFPLSTSHKI
jgi:hypothetical protein